MTLISITVWLIFGTIAGWIASIIAGVDSRHNIISNSIVGIVGAMLGGFIVSQLGGRSISANFDPYSIAVAICGAALLLLGYRVVSRT